MTLSDLTSKIEPLYNEMKQITLEAGVPESQYNKIKEETSSIEELSERLGFLQAIRHEQYQGVLVIWRLLKPEVWQRYQDMGERSLREQLLLKDARKKLKRIWSKKYGQELSPIQEVASGSDAGESVRSA